MVKHMTLSKLFRTLPLLFVLCGQAWGDIPFPSNIPFPNMPIIFPDNIPFPHDPIPYPGEKSVEPPRFLSKRQTTVNVERLGDRHYSNTMARFLSIDRRKALTSLYAYTWGDPIVFSDPSGFAPPELELESILEELLDENNEDTRGIDRQGVVMELLSNMESTAVEVPGAAVIEVNVTVEPPSASSLGTESRNQLFGTRDREQTSYGNTRRVNLAEMKMKSREMAEKRRAIRERGSISDRAKRHVKRMMFGTPVDNTIDTAMDDPRTFGTVDPEPRMAVVPDPDQDGFSEIDLGDGDGLEMARRYRTQPEQLGSSYVGYQDQYNIPRSLYDDPNMAIPGMAYIPDDAFAVTAPTRQGWSIRKKVALGLGIGAGVAILGGIGYGIYAATTHDTPTPAPGPKPKPAPDCRVWYRC